MNVTQKISHFLQLNFIDSPIYYKTYIDRSKRSQKWKTNFWWVCFRDCMLPRRPMNTLFHRCKHLHTHLAAHNTLTKEISGPIRTILVFDQIIFVSFGMWKKKLEGNCKISWLDSNPTEIQRLQASFVDLLSFVHVLTIWFVITIQSSFILRHHWPITVQGILLHLPILLSGILHTSRYYLRISCILMNQRAN